MLERIDIKQVDLDNEKVTEANHLYIEMGDNYFIYSADYWSSVPKGENEDDHTLGWEDRWNLWHIKIMKDKICSLEINWLAKRELYSVEIEVSGYPNTIKFYFKTLKEAKVVNNKIDNFIFGTKEIITQGKELFGFTSDAGIVYEWCSHCDKKYEKFISTIDHVLQENGTKIKSTMQGIDNILKKGYSPIYKK